MLYAIIVGILTLMFFSPMHLAMAQPFSCTCGDENRVLCLTSPPMKGDDVKELQARLKELGYFSSPVTGVFGSQTHRAVVKFQRDNSLPADGKVTAAVWSAMAKGIGERQTTGLPPPLEPIELVIDLDKLRLTVYSEGKAYKTYPVAVGKAETPSPIGDWKIIHKGYDWGGGFGTRWLGLNVPWGIYGIHGTNKPWTIGTRASHGCFRMFNRDVEELFSWVKIGTPVRVITNQPQRFPFKPLQQRHTGREVVLLQLKLKDRGLYWGPADGRFGSFTTLALKYFQAINRLEPTGVLDKATYDILQSPQQT